MNTPAHAILNLAVLGRRSPDRSDAIFFGAILPDAPMFVFFFFERFVVGASMGEIWGEAYFRDSWQDFFDVFNSIPLLTLGMLAAWRAGWDTARLVFASALLHCAFDLPLHHDDGHRHFFPLSDFRFASPVSYWDPDHFGSIGALFEVAVLWIGGAVLWRRHPKTLVRLALGMLAVLSGSAWLGFYVLRS